MALIETAADALLRIIVTGEREWNVRGRSRRHGAQWPNSEPD
jgi:hypothetical protein